MFFSLIIQNLNLSVQTFRLVNIRVEKLWCLDLNPLLGTFKLGNNARNKLEYSYRENFTVRVNYFGKVHVG